MKPSRKTVTILSECYNFCSSTAHKVEGSLQVQFLKYTWYVNWAMHIISSFDTHEQNATFFRECIYVHREQKKKNEHIDQ